MQVVVVAIAAFFGAMWAEAFGAVSGALLAWLVLRSMRQATQIAQLQQGLRELQVRPAGASANRVEVAQPAPEPAPEAALLEAPGAAPLAVEGVAARATASPTAIAGADATASAAEQAIAAARPREARAPTAPTAPRTEPVLLAAARAWLFGGNTIVKAGVGILFIGLAFLAKYAGEHVSVPVELRLMGIATVALALMALGWRLRASRPAYAQVLQGGAVATLYLTLFVAFRYYGVLAAGPVFAMMVLVAALAAALAVLQDARALAVIGALGGFATPLLVSSGSGNQVALFAYYLVLDLGIAAVAWYRTWRVLNLVGFYFTFVVGTAWGVMRYRSDQYLSSQAFLIVFFLLFNAILLMPARRLDAGVEPASQRPQRWVNGSLLFGLPSITFALQYGLVRHSDYGIAFSALVLAAFYVVMARLMRSRADLGIPFDASLAMAIVFLSLVVPFALDARSTGGAWALEGAALVWLGLRQARGLPRVFGYALLALAGLAICAGQAGHGTPSTVFNPTFFSALLAAAASLAAACFVQRAGPSAGVLKAHEAWAQPVLIGWGTLWALVAAATQIDAFVTWPYGLAAWLVALSAIALVYTAAATRLAWPGIAFPVLGHAPALGLGVMVAAAALNSPLDGGGWWAWPIALATHAAVLWRAARHWPQALQNAIHMVGLLVVAAFGALWGRAVTGPWGDASSAWAWLGWLVVPALLLIGLPHPAIARRWPFNAAPKAYQTHAAAALAAGLLAWALLANLASDGSASPLPYVPLLNPLDLGIGVALFGAWQWLSSDRAWAGLRARPLIAAAGLGLSGFVWLNAMLIRAFHHYGGVPFRVEAWMQSLAVQTGITLLWAFTALVLMWLAARRALRAPWMVGAALLGAVVLKLVLVDLSGSGTLTRIVSFISVGVLMLLIGYVAPLPAKESRHVAQ